MKKNAIKTVLFILILLCTISGACVFISTPVFADDDSQSICIVANVNGEEYGDLPPSQTPEDGQCPISNIMPFWWDKEPVHKVP